MRYPGLKSFPQHALAKEQASGFGAMLWFEVEGGVKAGKKLMDSVKLCTLAENLGSVETLITHPVTMTHAVVEPAERKRVGITDGLVRLSVGIEDAEDLIADLARGARQALAPRGAAMKKQTRVTHPKESQAPRRQRPGRRARVPQREIHVSDDRGRRSRPRPKSTASTTRATPIRRRASSSSRPPSSKTATTRSRSGTGMAAIWLALLGNLEAGDRVVIFVESYRPNRVACGVSCRSSASSSRC